MDSISIDNAIEVFARGFCFTRSFTHPYLATQLEDGVWVIRDGERSRGNYRTEEYIAHGADPAKLDKVARRHTRGRYRICAILAQGEDDTDLRAGYKSLGYRLGTTEAFMVHDLQHIKRVDAAVEVVRIMTLEQADALAKAARARQILPEYLELDPPPMREYMALDGEKIVGWVGSVAACGAAWCTSMYVLPEYRRRGIAKVLMTRMLKDDAAAGAEANVLLASHAGAKLYPVVGYRQIGQLYAYTPPR